MRSIGSTLAYKGSQVFDTHALTNFSLCQHHINCLVRNKSFHDHALEQRADPVLAIPHAARHHHRHLPRKLLDAPPLRARKAHERDACHTRVVRRVRVRARGARAPEDVARLRRGVRPDIVRVELDAAPRAAREAERGAGGGVVPRLPREGLVEVVWGAVGLRG